jgi:hypothetical protein
MAAAEPQELNFEFEVVDQDTTLPSDPKMNPSTIDLVAEKATAACAAVGATGTYVVEKTTTAAVATGTYVAEGATAAYAAVGATGTYVAEKTTAAAVATGTYVAEGATAACAAAVTTGTYVAEKTSAAAAVALPVACASVCVGCQAAQIGLGTGLTLVNIAGLTLMQTLQVVENLAESQRV